MHLKHLMLTFVVFGAARIFAGGFTTGDYVQSGLIAHWDAIDNTGRGYHDVNQTYWYDLKGARPFVLTKIAGASSVEWRNGNSAFFKAWGECGGILSEADSAAVFGDGTAGTVRTVEIVYNCNGQTIGVLLSGNTASKIALGRYNGSTYVANDGAGSSPALPSTAANAFSSLSVGYEDGVMTVGATNGAIVATSGSGYWDSSDGRARLGYRKNTSNSYNGYIYAIRVYNRLLSADDVAKNHETDVNRFTKKLAFSVISGSVTVGGVTYSAGDRYCFGTTETAVTIDAAADAVIKPEFDSLDLTLTAGTLGISPQADGSLVRLGGLALGANTILNMPTGGLTVAGTLTADATASVNGTGLLVGTADSSPVALTGGATYLSSKGTFTGLPASGTAYLPAGTVVTVATAEDAAKLANLSAIVFLDDGTSAANETTVRYTYSEPLVLSASLQGPGVFDVRDSGDIVLLGNSAGLTGNFAFSNVNAVVSNEYGLGSARSRTAMFDQGYKGRLNFGCKRPVFTNYAPVAVRALNVGNNYNTTYFGSASLDEILVQAAPFTNLKTSSTSGSHNCVLKNKVEFLGTVLFNNLAAYQYCWVSGTTDGWVRYGGPVTFNGAAYHFLNGINLHLNNTSFLNIPLVMDSTASLLTIENPGALGMADVQYKNQGTIDLNGIDTPVRVVGKYSSGSVKVGDATQGYVTSATPAQFRIVGSDTRTCNLTFQNEAGLTLAGSGKYTFVTIESTGTGKLAVENGTLTLSDSYCWHGTNVVISGGELVLSSNRALPDGKAVLSVTGGKLTVKQGSSVVLGNAYFGSGESRVKLSPKTYTVAELQAMEGVGDYIGSDSDAAATVVVEDSEPDPTVWHGWPEEGGEVAVPKKMTVYIGDADVDRVARVTTLDLHAKSSVVCTNATKTLVLSAAVIGSGKFTADHASVVILGDNSGLTNPGSFEFIQSDVVVSNRYGLGGALTAPCYVRTSATQSPVPKLHFGGPATTNDVEIILDNTLSFGYETDELTFVQNANFTQTDGRNNNPGRLETINDCGFAKALAGKYFRNRTTMRLLPGSTFAPYGGIEIRLMGQGKYHFACADGKFNTTYLFVEEYSEVFFESAALVTTIVYNGPRPVTYHFNGYDQTFGSVYTVSYNTTTPDVWQTDADKPMTVALAAFRYQGTTEYQRYFRLDGPISLDYDGDKFWSSGYKSAYGGFSTSSRESTFTMRSGTLRFFDGSTFGGSTLTILKGSLGIAAGAGALKEDMSRGPFFKRWVNLVIDDTNGGKLTLATGRAEKARSLCLNGTCLAPGIYGGADALTAGLIDVDHKLDCLGAVGDGAGTLRVLQDTPNPPGLQILVR